MFKIIADKKIDIKLESSVTIHDSCKMVRELNCSDDIRKFLNNNDVEVKECRNSGRWTICCGGPGKLLFPQLAEHMGANRNKELTETGADVVLSFCPYCLAAFEKFRNENDKARVLDFIEYLHRGLEL